MTFEFNEKELIYTILGAIIKLLISFPNFIKLLLRSYSYVSDNINVWISIISGRFVFQCHFRFNIMSWKFWCMFKPLSILLGKVLVEPIRWAGWCTQLNGQVWDHSMTFRSGGRFYNLFPRSYSTEILFTVMMSVWPLQENYVICFGQENDIICHPIP